MMDKKEYAKLVKKKSPNSPCFKNCLKAFMIGGAICALGEGLTNLWILVGFSQKAASTLCSVTLILLGVIFTAAHLYDRIAKHAGAGTLVPITGFANSMASAAIEFKSEGFVTGLGAKMFVICGPVIVYGVFAAAIYGVICLLFF